jgi:hypothetical protein
MNDRYPDIAVRIVAVSCAVLKIHRDADCDAGFRGRREKGALIFTGLLSARK